MYYYMYTLLIKINKISILYVLQQAISLEWRILTRDTIIYIISVAVLVVVMWDGLIELYEAILLMVLFVGYLTILFCSKWFMRCYNKLAHLCTGNRSTALAENESKLLLKS